MIPHVRWENLRFRYAVLFSLFIAVILTANALLLVYFKYKEFQNDIEQRAFSFANLAVKPLCDGYDTYYYSGYFKFRELTNNLMASEPDLSSLLLVDVNGKILFNSEDLKKTHFIPQPISQAPPLMDPYYVDAIRKLEISQRYGEDAKHNKTLVIVSPYIEEWGRHKLSVIMYFSYGSLFPQIRTMIYQVFGLTLLSMLFTSALAWIVIGKMIEPLDLLTEKARKMIRGSVEEIEIEGSTNEIQLLTDTFNVMTSRIQQTIQQLEESNLKLAAVNDELKQLDRIKSDLLANVSHELRTPLTSIKGYTEYILEQKLGPVTNKQEKGLLVMQKNLDRLSKLISALLDYSLMEAEKMVLTIRPFNLAQLCHQLQANLGSELEKRNLQLRIEVSESLPSVLGDKDKIFQVIENLTINAIKFTDPGGCITISAVAVQEGGEPFMRVDIADTGIGIPEPAMGRIFDRFYQVDASTKRKYGGMGLGLAIAKSIMDAHHGRIEVESKIGEGTIFSLFLPSVSRIFSDQPDLPIRKDSGEPHLILVVDGDPEIRRLLRMYLEDEGFHVAMSSTAEEGLNSARQLRPNVIILDVLLPDQDGFHLLQTLKADPATASIPVLILSIIKERLRGLDLGAADYLIKPVGHSLLRASLQRILGRRGPAKTVLIVDDEEDTLRLLSDRLHEAGFQTIEALNGREAIEKAHHNHPDLILLDIMMPEVTGWEVMEKLKEAQETASIPVVVLSAAVAEADLKKGYQMGIKQYVTKPFKIRELISQIRRVVQEKES